MLDDDDFTSPVLERRQILRSGAALGLFGLGLGRAVIGHPRPSAGPDGAGELDLDDLIDDPTFQAVCTLMPGQIQGPFYVNLNLVRSDISEGLPGTRARLWLNVVRASDCSPVPNARVDVWHADSAGLYSNIANQGTAGLTFLRGVQFTDANGLAIFDTIFPGWYPGRTTHIHVKTKPTGNSVLTSQMYFTQALNNRVHARMPYSANASSITVNSADGFFDPLTRMSLLGIVQGVLQLEFTIGVP